MNLLTLRLVQSLRRCVGLVLPSAALAAHAQTFQFVALGDFKSGSTRCSNEEFQAQLQHFGLFEAALVFAMQADVFDSKSMWDDFPGHSGFRTSIGGTLLPLAAAARIPVLLIHGDSHVFRFDQPFTLNNAPITNLTRLEVPGANDMRAVHVTVDTRAAQPWAVRLVEAGR